MHLSQTRIFSQISFSHNNVTHRIKDMSQETKMSEFCAFWLERDESTDISDSAQLLVFNRRESDNIEIA